MEFIQLEGFFFVFVLMFTVVGSIFWLIWRFEYIDKYPEKFKDNSIWTILFA